MTLGGLIWLSRPLWGESHRPKPGVSLGQRINGEGWSSQNAHYKLGYTLSQSVLLTPEIQSTNSVWLGYTFWNPSLKHIVRLTRLLLISGNVWNVHIRSKKRNCITQHAWKETIISVRALLGILELQTSSIHVQICGWIHPLGWFRNTNKSLG